MDRTTLAALSTVLACVLAPADVGHAEKWPRPAAGVSASGDPEVIFTFDDGPDERSTPIILDALAAHQVQAIFFWVGHRVKGDRQGAAARRAVVGRAIRGGHLVGNHTVSHAHLCTGLAGTAAAEIDENQALYATLTGLPQILFRVPYGSHCARVVALLGERRLSHMHWDIDPQDFLGKSSQQTARFVIGKLSKLEGRAVLLMHDTKSSSARAVPVILDWIAAENLRRSSRGERPIRIVSGSDLLAERLDPGLVRWARAAADITLRGLLGDLRRVLPLGLAATPGPGGGHAARRAHNGLGAD